MNIDIMWVAVCFHVYSIKIMIKMVTYVDGNSLILMYIHVFVCMNTCDKFELYVRVV
jgi:hypothetical protein